MKMKKDFMIVLVICSLLGASVWASQIDGRFIEDGSISAAKLSSSAVTSSSIQNNAVGAAKIRLENDAYLRSRNSTDSGDVNMLKVDATDRMLFDTFPHTPSMAPTDDYDVANKKYVDDNTTQKTWLHEMLGLSAGNISNHFRDASQDCDLASVTVHVLGLKGSVGSDYTLSSVSGATRITFIAGSGWGNNSQQSLVEGDSLDFQCQY